MEKGNSSGFKGVTKSATRGKWNATIRRGDTRIHIGTFETREQANEAYWKKAQEIYGEFARRG